MEEEQKRYGNADEMWAPKTQDKHPKTFDFDMFGMPSAESGVVVKKA